MGEQEKKKTKKKPHAEKSAAQYYRTARNKERRRALHLKNHPHDKQSIEAWKKNPIRTSRSGK